MWAQALGPNAGVTFAYVGKDQVCKGDDGQWDLSVPNDVLVMRVGTDSSHYNYIGWKPGKEKGRMVVEIDLNEIMSEDYYKVTIAHEFGHVLGLEHEHQRYDAPQFIKLETKNINNYAQLPTVLKDFNAKYGTNYQESDVLTDFEVVLRMSKDLNAAKIPLEGLVPYKEPKHWPDGDGFRIIDLETNGPMDFWSIMMYPSDTGSYNNFDFTMIKVDGGDSWPLSRTITSGDAQAVKRLYPDNQAPKE